MINHLLRVGEEIAWAKDTERLPDNDKWFGCLVKDLEWSRLEDWKQRCMRMSSVDGVCKWAHRVWIFLPHINALQKVWVAEEETLNKQMDMTTHPVNASALCPQWPQSLQRVSWRNKLVMVAWHDELPLPKTGLATTSAKCLTISRTEQCWAPDMVQPLKDIQQPLVVKFITLDLIYPGGDDNSSLL